MAERNSETGAALVQEAQRTRKPKFAEFDARQDAIMREARERRREHDTLVPQEPEPCLTDAR